MLPITHNSYAIPGVDAAKLHAEAQDRLAKAKEASVVHAHKLNAQCNNDCVEYNNG